MKSVTRTAQPPSHSSIGSPEADGNGGNQIIPGAHRPNAPVDRSVGQRLLACTWTFYLMTGAKRAAARTASVQPKGVTNSAALRVVFALVSAPDLLNSPFKRIASAAGVPLGTAYNALDSRLACRLSWRRSRGPVMRAMSTSVSLVFS